VLVPSKRERHLFTIEWESQNMLIMLRFTCCALPNTCTCISREHHSALVVYNSHGLTRRDGVQYFRIEDMRRVSIHFQEIVPLGLQKSLANNVSDGPQHLVAVTVFLGDLVTAFVSA
jgi:hypothetical protein